MHIPNTLSYKHKKLSSIKKILQLIILPTACKSKYKLSRTLYNKKKNYKKTFNENKRHTHILNNALKVALFWKRYGHLRDASRPQFNLQKKKKMNKKINRSFRF